MPYVRSGMVVLLGLLVVLGAPVTSLAQSLDDVRQERRGLQQRLDAAATELGEIEQVVAEIEAERDELTRQAEGLREELGELDDLMAVRVRSVFKHGTALDPVAVFLASDDPQEALSKAETVHRLVRGDQVDSEGLVANRTRLASVSERLESRRSELDAAVAEQERLASELEADLRRAQALEERLTEEQRERERQRRAAAREAAREAEQEREAAQVAEQQEEESASSSTDTAPSSTSDAPTTGGMACPVDQPRSFSDTWGDPRSGGRSHRGTDILAPMGTPVRAITDGVWDIQRPGPSAGLWAILRGSDGNQYWYMHLQSHTVSDGARVSAGQQTGTNGDTGNARGTPHVHFELHPGGGGAINPYPTLRRVCG